MKNYAKLFVYVVAVTTLETPPSGKQLGRFSSSDVVDGELVLAKLLVFLECSDSHYIDKKFGMFFNMYLNKFKLKVRCQ